MRIKWQISIDLKCWSNILTSVRYWSFLKSFFADTNMMPIWLWISTFYFRNTSGRIKANRFKKTLAFKSLIVSAVCAWTYFELDSNVYIISAWIKCISSTQFCLSVDLGCNLADVRYFINVEQMCTFESSQLIFQFSDDLALINYRIAKVAALQWKCSQVKQLGTGKYFMHFYGMRYMGWCK